MRCSIATVTSASAWSCADEDADADDGPREAVEAPDLFPQAVASGDPRPNTVVLWTRLDPDVFPDATTLELELFYDAALTLPVPLGPGRTQTLALHAHDGCVKVRVEGLEPATSYAFRFVVQREDGTYASSPLGVTKTAPDASTDVPVRFAVLSCQDFIGRYYNALAHLAQQQIDFVVHLGDYIYETTGDPSFQMASEARSIVFRDAAGALTFQSETSTFQAARSLDNYRQLYRTVRSDPALQRLHARVPWIVVWDDHEFSNDCHGATATYTEGRVDETDLQRRANANMAWFEYMPVDYDDPSFVYDGTRPPPDDISIHRDFVFGRHLHLLMTDLRSRRTDHLIAEDAYPGHVLVDEGSLAAHGAGSDLGRPYVPDIETYAEGTYAGLLRDAAAMEGYPTERIRGPISAAWINDVVATFPERGTLAIDAEALEALPRGLAVFDLGKASLFSALGSRMIVRAPQFALWSDIAFEASEGATEDILGPAQEAWFVHAIETSTTTWRVWGNSFALMPLALDLSGQAEIPESFAQSLLVNVDDWNGAPHRRSALIERLAARGNAVAVTGDLHTFLAGTASSANGLAAVPEFVVGSVSSANTLDVVGHRLANDPDFAGIPGLSFLISLLPGLLSGPRAPSSNVAAIDAENHGYGLVAVNGQSLNMTWFRHPRLLVTRDHYDDPDLDTFFERTDFRIDSGSTRLFRLDDATWTAWDPETRTWV